MSEHQKTDSSWAERLYIYNQLFLGASFHRKDLIEEMEFYPKDDLDTTIVSVNEESEIKKIYSGSHIFITGATGFMGKILLEKIIRTCNVAQVYLLVREKKGKTQAERIQDLLSDVVFERMLIENRNARQIITLINGDCTLPDLGLSEGDRRILRDQVDFVFHLAATTNMTEHLKRAFYINVNATRYLLEQAKSMTKIKAFIHVSTAYSQAMRDYIEERFYPTKFSAEELEQLVLSLDDTQLSAITPIVVDDMVNTYSLTKAITEYMVSRYHPDIPVAVVRPSIVISTASEPLVGWTDNVNGPFGLAVGASVGLLRVWYTDPDAVYDLIPVDLAINTMIAVGWHVAAHRPEPENKVVFNSVSSVKKPITLKKFVDICNRIEEEEQLETMMSIGRRSFSLTKNAAIFTIYTLWFHFIPGLFCDVIMSLAKVKPKFLYAYRKVYIANKAVAPYSLKEYKFVDDNVDEVWALMNGKDKQLFNFDWSKYTYEQYLRYFFRGGRVYLLKDPMDTLPQARKRNLKIYYFTHFIRGILFLIGGWLLFILVSTLL